MVGRLFTASPYACNEGLGDEGEVRELRERQSNRDNLWTMNDCTQLHKWYSKSLPLRNQVSS